MKNSLLIGSGDKLPLSLHLIEDEFKTGISVVDFDGSLARAVADIIPPALTERTFYFDPSDDVNVASFNVFKRVKDKHKLVQDISAFFDAMFAHGSDTLTRLNSSLVLATVLTIILDNPKPSFIRVLEFLKDAKLQKQFLGRCSNPVAVDNWNAIQKWDATQRTMAFANIQAKFGTLLLSPLMYRTLQGKPTFHLTKSSILIANLSRQRLGDTAAKLLGTLIVSRAKTPVFINGFHFIASDHLSSLFSQGGYAVTLQFLSTVPPNVAQELLAFPRKYVFNTTPEEAETLKYFVGQLDKKPLLELSPDEFLPRMDVSPPDVSGRFDAVLRRSLRHTRRK